MFVADIKEVFLKRKKKKVERNFPLFSKMVSKPVVLVEKGLVCILSVPTAKYIASENSRFFSLLGCFRGLLTKPIFRPFSCAPVGYITTWRNVSKESHVSNSGDKDCYFMLAYFLQSPPFVIRSMTLFFLTWGSGSWGSMLGSYYEVLKKIWPPHLRDVIHEWNFNRNHLLSDIDTQNWDVWDEWRIKFLNVVNTHAPLRTKRVRSKRFPLDYFRVEKTDAWTRHHAWSWKQLYTFKEHTGLGWI